MFVEVAFLQESAAQANTTKAMKVIVRMTPNDPGSATAATRRADCNRDGPPPFAAAWLGRASVNQVRAKVRNFPIFDFLNPLVQASSVHLPKLATKLKVLNHHIAFSFFKEVFGQTYVGSKTVHLR